jgi:hypothetical protein
VTSGTTFGGGGGSTSGAVGTGTTDAGKVQQGVCDASPAPIHALLYQVLFCKITTDWD